MFKFITQSEYDKLKWKTRAGSIKTAERLWMQDLSVGKAAIIKKKEWTLKCDPKNMTYGVKNWAKKYMREDREFDVRTLADETGWAIKRIK